MTPRTKAGASVTATTLIVIALGIAYATSGVAAVALIAVLAIAFCLTAEAVLTWLAEEADARCEAAEIAALDAETAPWWVIEADDFAKWEQDFPFDQTADCGTEESA